MPSPYVPEFTSMTRIAAVLCFTVALIAAPLAGRAAEWGPWSVSPGAPVVDSLPPPDKEASRAGPAGRLLTGAVRFFQKFISPVDGERCTMVPTCSHYGLQAIRKHGALLGFIMTADRIVHEYEEQRFVPSVWDGRSHRFLDPVENNDFWFSPASLSGTPVQPKAKE
jgi:putative membrane protein insertion efficiency factor